MLEAAFARTFERRCCCLRARVMRAVPFMLRGAAVACFMPRVFALHAYECE